MVSFIAPVENLHQEEMSSIVTWRASKYYKTKYVIRLIYHSGDANCKDSGSKRVEVILYKTIQNWVTI